MATIGNGFDRLAGIYDPLARLVYGRSIVRAQLQWLKSWPKGAEILVVGGGTGWFLEKILEITQPKSVVYVEISAKMLQKSRVRILKNMPEALNKVNFVLGTVHTLAQDLRCDIICTHFYLDMFEGDNILNEIAQLQGHLRAGGHWSLVDFRYVPKGTMRFVSHSLIWVMYRFFRFITGIQAQHLEDFQQILAKNKLEILETKYFYGGMIQALLWSKPN